MSMAKANFHLVLIPTSPCNRRRSQNFSLNFTLKMRFLAICIGICLIGAVLSQECLPDDERVDCHPDAGDTPERCLARGCSHCDSSTPGRNTPICFFKRNYGYRMVGDPMDTGAGYVVELERLTNDTIFGNESQHLYVIIDFQSDYRLRVRISDFDVAKPRWEVPLRIDPPIGNLTVNRMYDVTFTNEPYFAMKIMRKETGTVLLDSSMDGFTFSDQFIQFGWKLPSKNVYGIGENEQHSLRHNFENRPLFPLWGSGLFPDYNKNLYGVHPQYTVLEEDGNAHSVVIINSNAQEIEMHPSPGIIYKTIGGIIDMYVFHGPTPEDTARQYSEAVGRFPLPPYWALGFHLCRYGYNNIETMKATVDRMIAAEIPYDVQYGDIDIMDGNRDFTVSPDRFAGLGDYVKELKTKGIKFMTILDPCIANEEPRGTYRAFDLGQEMDVWVKRSDDSPVQGRVWPGNCYFPDYAKNTTHEWWKILIKEFHEELEFDSLWIDMNEPSNFVTGDVDRPCEDNQWNYPPYYPKTIRDGQLSDNTICADHVDVLSRHYNTHNMYGNLQSEPTFLATNEAVGKRTFTLSRSNFIGLSRWATHWLGDNYSNWENLYYSIIGVLQFNMFAIPFVGPDICGHQRDAEVELCQRWQEVGAFYPFSRNHNADGMKEQDPASFDGQIVNSTRKALLVRYTLLPYLYNLLSRHEKWGETVARPMWNPFPMDTVARGIDRQFFWGSGVLITPVLDQGHTTVQAYFPDSRFYDYYTGEEVKVRANWTVLDAPLDHINVHIHGGHIIPTQEPAVNTAISKHNPFGLIVALDDDEKASGSLFYDDGESFETLQSGFYFLAQIRAANKTINYVAHHNGYPGMSVKVVNTIRLLGVDPSPTRVFVNGTAHASFSVLPSKEVLITNLDLKATVNFNVTYE